VKAIDVSLSTNDVVAFVNVTSVDCGVTLIVHLDESSLKFQVPPAGISSVPTAEPLATLLTCHSHGVVEVVLVTTVMAPPMLEVQLANVNEVTFARVCVVGT
jgi:hypothetical protein